MPRLELPGMYFDEERNRYFPLSSRPATHTGPIPPVQGLTQIFAPRGSERSPESDLSTSNEEEWPSSAVKTDRRWRRPTDVKMAYSFAARERIYHDVVCARMIAPHCLPRRTTVVGPSDLTALCTELSRGGPSVLAGDENGWLHQRDPGPYMDLPPGVPLPLYNWKRVWKFGSRVTAICSSSKFTIAVCFGPPVEAYAHVQNQGGDNNEGSICILTPPPNVYDIWTASIYKRGILLGASKKVVYMPDIDAQRARFNLLSAHSDVLALRATQNLVYSGLRNGSVLRFDLRALSAKPARVCGDEGIERSSVTNLELAREHELLVSSIDGGLFSYDLRYALSRCPLKVFKGHTESYSTGRALTVDPDHNFVLAAAGDCRVRMWSLQTAERLQVPEDEREGVHGQESHLLNAVFDDPVTGIQITREEESHDLCVRLTAGRKLFEYQM